MTLTTAAVAREHGAPLALEELALDGLRDNEVRVRMVASGICHTDAIVRDGMYPTPLPAVLGHEGAGVVEEVGSRVTTVRPGDHVVLSAAYCTHCRRCRAGQMAYCENLLAEDFGGRRSDGTTALTGKDGESISSHFFGQSHASRRVGRSRRSAESSSVAAANGGGQLEDAANGDDRPDVANGAESEFPPPDPGVVAGPAGGLVKDGPLE